MNLQKLLSYIYPVKCVCCGTVTDGAVICTACGDEIERESAMKKQSADSMFAPYRYMGKKLVKAIFALKQKNNAMLFRYFAGKIAETVEIHDDFYCITNVPRSGSAMNEFGFDQSCVLAKNLSGILGIPYMNLLRQHKKRREQKTLSREERFENAAGKYKLKKALPVNANILLVDDVVTTGATSNACIEILKGAGANKIHVLAIART